MLRIAICEDCDIQVKIIFRILDNYQKERPGIKISKHWFSSGSEFLSKIDMVNSFDLFLLDVQMPNITGIEVAKKIRELGSDAAVVFLTFDKEYAYEAFKVFAIQYFKKPISQRALFPILDKVAFDTHGERYFKISGHDGLRSVPFSEIVYVELVGRKMVVNLTDRSSITSKSLQTSFSQAVKPLLDDVRFVSVHQAYVVNISCAVELKANGLIVGDDIQIPISRSKFPDVKRKYLSL